MMHPSALKDQFVGFLLPFNEAIVSKAVTVIFRFRKTVRPERYKMTEWMGQSLSTLLCILGDRDRWTAMTMQASRDAWISRVA